jgi:SAM-dependent methyltransferase
MKGQDSLNKDFQKDYWEHNANARDYKDPIVKFFVQQRLDWVKRHLDISKLKSAYDVGCGDGFATYYFNELIPDVRGGDIAEYMLRRNPLPKSKLAVIDAEHLPLKGNSYDLVYTWEVLHHVPDPQQAVSEMARASKKYVLIFEPNRTNILQFGFGLLTKQERGTLRSTRRYLRGLCENAGLEIVACDYVGKIPPNKTPTWMMPLMRRLPFKSTAVTGISIGIIARKK